jgi:Peptidase family M28
MAEILPTPPAGPRGSTSGTPPPWALPLMLALAACCLVAVVLRLRPPAPLPAAAPAMEVSAGRAREVLVRLLGQGQPHPLGSAAAAEVRGRIVATLSGLGYEPRVQEGTGCSWKGSCGRVHNVVARRLGREPGAVALVAHYDSVAAGPGASDDMVGVAAALEVARVLALGPPPRHSIVLLIDEGEEEGLLGAESFMAESPDARDVKAVVNLEARGTSGPSMMFETSGDDAWLVAAWSRGARRPLGTSVAATIYGKLPYDTDLSVFKRHRVPGLNFAFIGGPARYHTPQDDLAHADPASLQHHCDNALSAVLGLAGADLATPPPRGSAAFFDVLGWGVVRWPLGWSGGMAVAAVGLLLLLVARTARRGGGLVRGLLLVPAVAAAAGAGAAAVEWVLLRPGVLAANWPAHPLPLLFASWLAGFLVTAAVAGRLWRRGDGDSGRGGGGSGGGSSALGLWAGVWSGWALVALGLAWSAPEMAYLFLVPALVAGACGLLPGMARGRPGALAAAAITPGVAAALLWFPVLLPLYLGLGALGLPVVCVLVALLCTTLMPLLPAAGLGRITTTLALAALLAAALLAAAEPRFTPDSPRLLNIVFDQDAASGRARWLVGGALPVPPPLSRAAPFGQPEVPFPFAPPLLRAVEAPASALAAPGPRLTLLASAVVDGRRHLRLRLTSPRGAPVATVYLPTSAGIEEARIDGRPIPTPPAGRFAPTPGWRVLADVTLAPGGCELQLVLKATGPLAWYVIDISPGLPPSGRPLLAARPPTAAPVREGDLTVFSRRVVI